MNALTRRANEKAQNSTVLQRIAARDKTAVKDCIDAYGNFIWALAKRLTASREAAEAVTEEIFIDIWQYCKSESDNRSVEEKMIAQIALRRLIKPFQYAENKSMVAIDATNEQGAGTDRISKGF